MTCSCELSRKYQPLYGELLERLMTLACIKLGGEPINGRDVAWKDELNRDMDQWRHYGILTI